MTDFEYREFDTVTLKGMRWYKIGDELYPSVTSVLGLTAPEEKKKSLESWRTSLGPAKADAYTKRCADRGTILHAMLEQYLKGEEVKVEGATNIEWGMFNGIKMKLKKIDKVIGQEVVLYSHGLEIAGRCDLIAIYKNEMVIIDFKSSTNPKTDKRIEDYKLQLCLYSLMHNEMFDTNITKGVILMGVENGLPMEFTVDLEPHIPTVFHRVEAFYKSLKI